MKSCGEGLLPFFLLLQPSKSPKRGWGSSNGSCSRKWNLLKSAHLGAQITRKPLYLQHCIQLQSCSWGISGFLLQQFGKQRFFYVTNVEDQAGICAFRQRHIALFHSVAQKHISGCLTPWWTMTWIDRMSQSVLQVRNYWIILWNFSLVQTGKRGGGGVGVRRLVCYVVFGHCNTQTFNRKLSKIPEMLLLMGRILSMPPALLSSCLLLSLHPPPPQCFPKQLPRRMLKNNRGARCMEL